MNVDIPSITENGLIIIPLVVALTQAFKITGWVSARFAPLLCIAVGIIIGFFVEYGNASITTIILNGIIYGLSSCGLYVGIKTTAIAVKNAGENVPRETLNHNHQNKAHSKKKGKKNTWQK